MPGKTLPEPASGFPILPADSTFPGIGAATNAHLKAGKPGFSGDGDYIFLPQTATATIDYFNNAGVSQSGWPVAVADTGTSTTNWLGFHFDETAQLLYTLARTAVTTDIYFASINSSGTVVKIATIVITAAAATLNFFATPIADGTCNMTRAADGSGDFTLLINAAPGTEHIIWNTAGTLGTDTTLILRASGNAVDSGRSYVTPNGTYIGTFDPALATSSADIIVHVATGTLAATRATIATVPMFTGAPYKFNVGGSLILWKGYVVMYGADDLGLFGSKAFLKADFDKWADELATFLGVAA